MNAEDYTLRLRVAALARRQAEQELDALIADAIEGGLSYEQVGRAIGVTGRAVSMRRQRREATRVA